MGYEHSLPLFQGGQIFIELESNSYIAGTTLKGVVHVFQQLPFMATQLVLCLIGYERTAFVVDGANNGD